MPENNPTDKAPTAQDAAAPRSASRRRLLRAGVGATPVVLSLVSAPVRATYYTSPASSFASINASRPPGMTYTNGCKPSWWASCNMSNWPSSCKNTDGTSKRFKDIFSDHATYGNKTIKSCLQMAYDSGMDGMVKHLCAAYLNAATGRTPASICSGQIARDIWTSYNSKGWYMPTAGVYWYTDSCQPSGNGGITPWLKTTMPLA